MTKTAYCGRATHWGTRTINKTLLVMKLTTFLLTAVFLNVSARGISQSITLSAREITLEKVFAQIKQQTGYSVLYSKERLTDGKPVTVEVKNMPLQQFLDLLFRNQPYKYAIQSHTIFISPRQPADSHTGNLAADSATAGSYLPPPATIDLEGQVLDTAGRPLFNANVLLSGTNRHTITASNGMFTLKDAPAKGTLVVSMIGYQSQTVSYSGPFIHVKMKQSVSELDALSVIAYGTTTRRLTTGAISRVGESDIRKNPASNPILSLEGRMPGVLVTENSGVAGSSFNINIRGINTVSAGKLPLYVVDGVPFDGKATEQSAGSYVSLSADIGSGGFNPLNILSPDMIESIEVLKDADATALYGSRAANGVVLITTKKAKAGATRLNANIYSGQTAVARTVPMLNADQYIAMRKQAYANDGVTPTATLAPDLFSFASGWNTDFQKYFFNTGHFTNASVELSGGNEETQFLLSSTYRYESPVFTGNFRDKVARVKLGIQHASKDKRFKLNAAANYAADNNVVPQFNLWSTYNLVPNLPLYNTDGSLAWYTNYTNPLSSLINNITQTNRDLLSNVSLSYQLMKGLSFKTDAGYHRADAENIYALFRAAKNPSLAAAATGSVYRASSYTSLYSIEPQLNYTTHIGRGQLQALVGGTYQYNNAVQPYFYSGTFTSDQLYKDIGSITISSKSSSFNERRYVSTFGRLNYNWENRYIVNGNFRRDGSSTFSPGNRFGNFGSIGAAWLVSEERFLKGTLPWLSFLKLRTSYGSIGNDQIPAYGYLSYYTSSTAYSAATTLNPYRLTNDNNYSWEVTRKLDAAADLGFFKDRILLSVNWYHNITSNMLLSSVPIAAQVGFTGYTGNVPGLKVQNNGLELELNTTNIQSKSFTWKTSFNISANRNKVVSFPGLASSTFATGSVSRAGYASAFVIGQPLDMLYGYHFTGFKNGVATVQDVNGDGVITAGLNANGKGDFVNLGTYDPKYYGGLSNSFSYKGFQLDVLFQFVKKKNFGIYSGSVATPGSAYNEPADVLGKGFTYTATASTNAYTSFTNYYAKSDATLSDASYIRLKNISLTWNLPRQWLETMHMQSASIYMRAQNLFIITKYDGFDPESYGSTQPLNKMILIGINTTF